MTIDGKERKVINYKNFLFGEEEQTIDNLREQNEQLKEILSIREQQLLSLVNANSSYSERMEHYVELAKKADADKEMIQNSEFWKMTKPVRLLTDILKKRDAQKQDVTAVFILQHLLLYGTDIQI